MKLFQKRLGQEPEDEDTSFNWLGNDRDYSDIPDALRGTDDEKSSTDTVTVRTLAITEDGSYTVEGDIEGDTVRTKTLSLCDEPALTIEEDAGIDPYNTTRLKVRKG